MDLLALANERRHQGLRSLCSQHADDLDIGSHCNCTFGIAIGDSNSDDGQKCENMTCPL